MEICARLTSAPSTFLRFWRFPRHFPFFPAKSASTFLAVIGPSSSGSRHASRNQARERERERERERKRERERERRDLNRRFWARNTVAAHGLTHEIVVKDAARTTAFPALGLPCSHQLPPGGPIAFRICNSTSISVASSIDDRRASFHIRVNSDKIFSRSIFG